VNQQALLVQLDAERRRNAALSRELARLTEENPQPVMRIAADGTLVYANAGSQPLLDSWGISLGQRVPPRWQERAQEALRTGRQGSTEARSDQRIYAVTIVPALEGHATMYGVEITDLRRVQRALRDYAIRLRALHQIDQAILSAESVEAIAEATLTRLPEMIDCAWASVILFDLDEGASTLLAAYSAAEHGRASSVEGWRAPIDSWWTALIEKLQQGRAVVTQLASGDQTDISGTRQGADGNTVTPDLPWHATLRSSPVPGPLTLLQQPLRVKGMLIGVLTLALNEVEEGGGHAIALASELADQLAIAIQQARLHEQVQAHAEDLERRVAWRTAALRISEARFRAIFEDAPLGIALLDREGRIIQSNTALETILSREGEELRETLLTGYMGQEEAEAGAAMYQDLISGATDGYHTETRFRRSDGQSVWCNLTVSLVRDMSQEPRLAIGMVDDISDRREAQAAMIQNEKLALTGQLAASLAHEINNPLQTVIGCLGLAEESLQELTSDATEARASVDLYLGMASEELKRAAGIVGRLRDLNRRSRPEEREAQRVRELVDHTLAITAKQCQDRGIKVSMEEGPDVRDVTVVPDRIQQVFLNLVLNAIDAMSHGGELSVRLTGTSNPQGVSIAFHDSGGGIPAEIEARLFDPFHTTKPEGLGLGLFISRTIVQDHAGDIKVRSIPGEGTTFTVWLPA
jgi:two-component system, LuxR family, sensor kinase FixL